MPIGAAIPLVVGLGGAAASGKGGGGGGGGKKGGGGSSGSAGLEKILGMQAGMMKKFEPMTSEWANMGNAYMGIGTGPGTGTPSTGASLRPSYATSGGGWGGGRSVGIGGNTGGYIPEGLQGGLPAQSPGAPGVGSQIPMELEDMPALRDLLYQPGGTNELLMRRQGGTARNQILENLPTGGVQQNAMAQQLRGENENLAGMRVDARQNVANMVLGGGPMLNPSTAMGGAASNTAGMAANAYAQQQQAKGTGMAGMGNMLGLIGGSAMQGKGGGGGK